MQIIYQFDICADSNQQEIFDNLDVAFDNEATREQAYALAQKAWNTREDADALIKDIAPKWPTYRQPPVDRSIIRLAYYEMAHGYSPAKVAINEAIEIAKKYASENSPAFINGVLDKLHKQLKAENKLPDQEAIKNEAEPKITNGDWLNDAKDA